MKSHRFLIAAEYTSLGLSALGTAVAATTGQIAYATSPLICSLFLNVVNRNKLDKRTQQNITHHISQVENSFSKDKFSLKEQIENIENTFNRKDNSEYIIQDDKQKFIELRQKIENLQSNFIQLKNTNHSNEIETTISSVQKQLNTINIQFDRIDKNISQLVKQQLDEFNYLIENNRPEYQLVFDRQGSRDVLLEALKEAQERIILVCPWITYYGANNEVLEYCRAFLNKGGCIDIGWGHLKDIDKKQHISMSRDEFLRIVKINHKDWVYNQLEKFIELEKQYPNLKVRIQVSN